MIAFCAFLFCVPLLVLLDGVLLEHAPLRVDLCAALASYFALFVRSRPLPALLLAVALSRAVLCGGGLAAQYLAFALPVAVLRPLRAVLDEHSFMVQAAVAPLMAFAIPRALEFFARLGGQSVDVLPAETLALLAAVLCVPLVTHLLRRVPPFRSFSTQARRRARGET